MRIKQIINAIGGCVTHPPLKDFEVSGVSCNSRNVGENFIFVAIKGADQDGHKFIQEAIDRGAKAIVVQKSEVCAARRVANKRGDPPSLWRGGRRRKPEKIPFLVVKDTRKALAELAAEFYGHPSLKLKIIGITGTNGKTTVSYLIEAILKKAKVNPGVIGTINYRFKDKVIPAKNTTPAPLELQCMLADMLKLGIDYAVMEVSSHALAQERIGGINFHSAIFTNLTQDHLDYHQTIKNYFQAKSRLFTQLKQGAYSLLNHDDFYGRKLKNLSRGRVITYGIDRPADIVAEEINFDLAQTEFMLSAFGKKEKFKTRLIGRHNIYNILASAGWAYAEGIDLSLIKSALENFPGVPGRLERIDFKGNFAVFVDYAHTEDALKNALTALREIAKKRIIVVFGCGGERDRNKRPKMGRVVSKLAHYAVITNDNPRREDPLEIIYQITKGISRDNYCVIPNRREAISKSLSLAKSGDIVLVAGKGHEDYQILKDKTIHFNDAEVIRECLKPKIY